LGREERGGEGSVLDKRNENVKIYIKNVCGKLDFGGNNDFSERRIVNLQGRVAKK
jgi:hypothetical protein